MKFNPMISSLCATFLFVRLHDDSQIRTPDRAGGGALSGVTRTTKATPPIFAWQDFFADERLKKLIELALTNNLDLRVAILNVEQSQAQYRITRSASFPTVDAGGSYTRSYAAGITG